MGDINNLQEGIQEGPRLTSQDFTRTVSGRKTDIHKDNPAEKLNYRKSSLT